MLSSCEFRNGRSTSGLIVVTKTCKIFYKLYEHFIWAVPIHTKQALTEMRYISAHTRSRR